MLLKRLAQGIRSRDWSTIFVELMVLIVGVFLGLQVDDWNQRRLDRIEEQYYLDRLGRDLKRSLSEQEKQLEAAWTNFEDALAIQKVLEARELGGMTASEFKDRIGTIRGIPRSMLVTATTEELIAGGKASLLRSNELREELADFVEWYSDQERFDDYVSSSIIDAYNRQSGFMTPEWTDPTNPPKWSADVEELMNDSDAVSTMRQLTNAYWIRWRDLRRLNTKTRDIYELLIKVSGGPHKIRSEGSESTTIEQ
jgi:hypothetical protein